MRDLPNVPGAAPPPLLVSEREAGMRLGVCPNTVGNLRRRGQLASVKVGARRMYAVDDLRQFVEQRREVQR